MKLHVTVVWFRMLFFDDREKVDPTVIDDSRAVQFWDDQRLVGRLYASDVNKYSPGEIAWDAFYLYGPAARWDKTMPVALASGSPVIRTRARLRHALAAMGKI